MITKNRVFTLEEARELLPLIRRITEKTVEKAEVYLTQLEYMAQNSKERKNVSDELNTVVNQWIEKIQRLGCHVNGLWLIDFDNGDGEYWCWQYPEEEIAYKHLQETGFAGRVPAEEEELSINPGIFDLDSLSLSESERSYGLSEEPPFTEL